VKGTGRLTIASSPVACSVSVDGVPHGSTPLTAFEVTAGVHRVDCVPAAGKAKSMSVAVADGAAAHYNFVLDE
jgi:hypothetical protein